MTWLSHLYDVYERFEPELEELSQTDAALLPIGHVIQQAQVEIVIDSQGNFQSASMNGKGEQPTGWGGSALPRHPHDHLPYALSALCRAARHAAGARIALHGGVQPDSIPNAGGRTAQGRPQL